MPSPDGVLLCYPQQLEDVKRATEHAPLLLYVYDVSKPKWTKVLPDANKIKNPTNPVFNNGSRIVASVHQGSTG